MIRVAGRAGRLDIALQMQKDMAAAGISPTRVSHDMYYPPLDCAFSVAAVPAAWLRVWLSHRPIWLPELHSISWLLARTGDTVCAAGRLRGQWCLGRGPGNPGRQSAVTAAHAAAASFQCAAGCAGEVFPPGRHHHGRQGHAGGPAAAGLLLVRCSSVCLPAPASL